MTKRALVFKPPAMQRIAEQTGFKGNINNPKEFGKFLEENPDAGKLMDHYRQQAKHMVAAAGGLVPVRKYQRGGTITNRELNVDIPEARGRVTEALTPAWLARAMDPSTPTTVANETVRTKSFYSEELGGEVLVPTIRLGDDGKLYKPENPFKEAMDKGDYLLIPGPDNEQTRTEAEEFSKSISAMIGRSRDEANNFQTGGVVSEETVENKRAAAQRDFNELQNYDLTEPQIMTLLELPPQARTRMLENLKNTIASEPPTPTFLEEPILRREPRRILEEPILRREPFRIPEEPINVEELRDREPFRIPEEPINVEELRRYGLTDSQIKVLSGIEPNRRAEIIKSLKKTIALEPPTPTKNFQTGGVVPVQTPQVTPVGEGAQDITSESIRRTLRPSLPVGAVVTPVETQLTQQQFVPVASGQVTGDVGAQAAITGTTLAATAPVTPAAQMATQQTVPQVATTVAEIQAAQVQTPEQIAAAQQDSSAVSGLQAAQGAASVLVNPVQRQIQEGELVSEAANAQTAATFSEQVEAATAQPSTQATVQGQFEQLFTAFDAANPPPWASGAVRAATQRMVQRGLGASSIAGQAIVQATLEAALPIAQADASIISQFELSNLSNRQQRAMLAAQQRAAFIGQEFDQRFQSRVQNAARVGDIANVNFTAEQQIALENSRNIQTTNLANLSNAQAAVLTEASALANLDMANLNNRQQAAIQNAQNFLQADLTNASAQQQTSLFRGQQRVQSLFTDQAAENAASQFNATSQNQTDQFFDQLQTQTAQFNTAQANAQGQFNAGQVNTVNRFNQELNNQRDQFNARNRLVIDQGNAVWRRQVATAATAQTNRVNEINARAVLDMSDDAYNNLWQHFSDLIEFAVDTAENEQDRNADLAIAQLTADVRRDVAAENAATGAGQAVGSLIGTLGTALIGGIF